MAKSTEQISLVVLGAAVWPSGPSPTLVRRSRHAAALFHEGRAQRVIACGGMGKHPPSEAAVIEELLIQEGVPKEAITCDDQSTTTYENLRNARSILAPAELNRVIIVTDSYHGPRAVMVACALGLSARFDAPPRRDAPIRLRVRQALRETAALPVYAVRLPFWMWRDR